MRVQFGLTNVGYFLLYTQEDLPRGGCGGERRRGEKKKRGARVTPTTKPESWRRPRGTETPHSGLARARRVARQTSMRMEWRERSEAGSGRGGGPAGADRDSPPRPSGARPLSARCPLSLAAVTPAATAGMGPDHTLHHR